MESNTKETEGWTIGVDSGKWSNNAGVETICGPEWYGWSAGISVGTISTMLNKSSTHDCGQLNFGNCNNAGTVVVYFDGVNVGQAEKNTPNKVIEFPITMNGLSICSLCF